MFAAPTRFVLASLVFCSLMGCRDEGRVRLSGIGEEAHVLAAELTALGERTAGSAGIERVRHWLESDLAKAGIDVQRQAFTASTPKGPVPMINLWALTKSSSNATGERVTLVSHYDSKALSGKTFLGANDAATSVTLMMAMAKRAQNHLAMPFDIQWLWVDGEEALVSWTEQDSLYGSRYFVSQIKDASKIKAVIVLDMISDVDLMIERSIGSDPELMSRLEKALDSAGHADKLSRRPRMIADDHVPFVRAGFKTLHMMDFTFGSPNTPGKHWHQASDTMDNVSAQSTQIVADAVWAILKGMAAE